jgi:hypothetical protein
VATKEEVGEDEEVIVEGLEGLVGRVGREGRVVLLMIPMTMTMVVAVAVVDTVLEVGIRVVMVGIIISM